ncbi:MAG: type I secretion C-terminal target domain-containing protein, partial [Methylococcaceae bacterium]
GTIPIKQIYTVSFDDMPGYLAIAALREDGSVVTWGDANSDSVASQLNGDIDVKDIYSGNSGFAALREDGSVVTWGGSDSSLVASQLNGDIDVTKIYSNRYGFTALRADGSVVTWGKDNDSSSVANDLNGDIDVKEIYSNHSNFAALRTDGSVITWGGYKDGREVTNENDLNGDIDVKEIYSNAMGFAALRVDGSVVILGNPYTRDLITYNLAYLDKKAISDQLTDVVSFANPKTDDVYIAPVISTKPTSGNDRLTGTANNDKLSALVGNDTLIGGLGADRLTGGKGADIFKYASLKDSGTTAKTRDTITDFKHSEKDKIDLSAIDANEKLAGDQAFTFIGSVAFNKTNASGQLRFDATSKILYGSTDADTTPEFSIQLSGVKSLVIGDFIL